ncbi:hypothetical protein [Flavobacterium microcysteis]|uniref:Uncharacterized protein n=1 Tax=Flavobacterium microcysteis TaxID=2596891 RepID=A0A501Q7Y0_9FLAO|nr:hypothetical protein [Flavobacterium microcysteis]TPD68514.1 hypothetical protein FJA49_10655 [Flavobacterium microcysteis]
MKKIIALCLFVSLFSCTSDKTETITVKNKYSVELPSFLSEAKGLHNQASLQYQNAFKEFYVVIIDEPKQEFMDAAKTTAEFSPDFNGYSQILRGSLEASLKEAAFTDTKDTHINGLNAKTFSLTGKMDEIPIFYDIAYVEGKNHFYQIVIWTIESSKDKFREPMDKIIASFKEIGSGKSSDRSLK